MSAAFSSLRKRARTFTAAASAGNDNNEFMHAVPELDDAVTTAIVICSCGLSIDCLLFRGDGGEQYNDIENIVEVL